MAITSATHRENSGAEAPSLDAVEGAQRRTAPFVLTLCQFEGPVSIRPPQSPQLRRFTFFTTRARHPDGRERVYVHMGYFESLADAQDLLPAVRRRFPHAIATRAPANLPQPHPPASALHPTERPTAGPAAPRFAPVTDETLTDTQVMKALEARGVTPKQNAVEEPSGARIGMLRPEDTSIRRALKQAVVEGAPVFFAVQLDWSGQPIESRCIPPLSLFKTHTLYAMESRREGRCRYFLRLGFFADAASAKEAAFSVRSKFASAVVVPVTEQEFTCAHEASQGNPGLVHVCLPIYEAADRSSPPSPAPEPKRRVDRARRKLRDTDTLEQTLETLAARERWNDPDPLDDTGVRHLKVEVLERESDDS